MPERYNDSPEAMQAAAKALLRRGVEILDRWADNDYPLADAICKNVGFHAATILLQETGSSSLIGKDAVVYICLLLAAIEHAHAQELLESALENIDA